MELSHHTSLAEKVMEMLALAMRYNIVSRTMEDNNRWIGRIDVGCSIESLESLLISLEGETHHSFFRSMIPIIHFAAAAHIVEVCRTRPATCSINEAAVAGICAKRSLKFCNTIACGSKRSKMGT